MWEVFYTSSASWHPGAAIWRSWASVDALNAAEGRAWGRQPRWPRPEAFARRNMSSSHAELRTFAVMPMSPDILRGARPNRLRHVHAERAGHSIRLTHARERSGYPRAGSPLRFVSFC